MNSFGTTATRLTGAASRVAEAVAATPIDDLADDALLEVLTAATEARKAADLVIAATSAVIDRRAASDRGHQSLVRKNGHRSVTSFVQHITGQSRSDVFRSLRTGEDLLETVATKAETGARDDAADGTAPTPPVPGWRLLLGDALTDGHVTTAQHHAIRTGLGEPPVERYPDLDPAFLPAAWARAVRILLDDARELPLEELRAAARTARDRLDPVGVMLRFEERYEARGVRRWVDEQGQKHARIDFDDENAAWFDAIVDTVLRPRRGPRFIDDEAPSPSDVIEDDRTNEQLQSDHLLAVLRTGAGADPDRAFGDRQPGVRIVIESDQVTVGDDGLLQMAGGYLHDGGRVLPGSVIEKYLCDTGTLPVLIDGAGRPLDVGREKRLFTAKQRTAMFLRLGGCIGVGCSAPPSECEAHHIDEWWAHGGRTDIDDGVPLCTPCHLQTHNSGAKILRERDPVTGIDTYWMHYPPDPVTGVMRPPHRLRSRSPLRFEAA